MKCWSATGWSSRALLLGSVLGTILLAGCGGDEDGKGDAAATDAVVDGTDDDAADSGAADAGSDGKTEGTLKWIAFAPPVDGKMTDGAALGAAGEGYLLTAEDGGLVRLLPTGPQVITVPGVGTTDLRAVYVDATGEAWIAGDASILVQGKGSEWQVRAEIPPSPVTRFRAIDGDGDVVWAVGDDARAYRKAGDAVFAAEDVTVTDGEAIGSGGNFVSVQVVGDAVWIAVDKGATSAGLALEKTAAGWKSYPLDTAPRALWRGADGATWVVGGTVEPYVARLQAGAFVKMDGLQWSLGFTAVDGTGADDVVLGALKGQIRSWDGKAFAVVLPKAPPGTVNPFAQPSGDIAAFARAAVDDWLVVTPFYVYRYAVQP
ncbi:MAG: hypothetical protein H6747_10070 [Deltaproteobacteria bacterium]|nr:hypothetical protein [Deltaproteobacteria bacterium]